jgi:Ni/Co efflux regulator RcnB
MKKLLSTLIAVTFATASVGAFAAAHGGAMSDADKAKKMEACKTMDATKADDKMKAECKKMMDDAKAAAAAPAPAKK